MVLDQNLTLSNNTVVMLVQPFYPCNAYADLTTINLYRVWISSQNVKAVAEKGYKIVHAASDYFYLDCGGGGWVGDYPAGNSWCDPFKTWQYVRNRLPSRNPSVC